MKIIISHDVDHIDASDHIFKDFIIEKLWIRSMIHFLQRKITFKVLLYRLTILFHNRMHRINEIMQYDREHGIPSTFFVGMDNVLGMSYGKKKAKQVIDLIKQNGFSVGVHGVDFENESRMQKEHDCFEQLSELQHFGIRNHYVRYNEQTFEKMSKVGYMYDTTLFNKKKINLRKPYKVNSMWEFPLHIMDGYICFPGRLEEGIEKTKEVIKLAEQKGMPYCTILFHDYQFDEKYSPQMKEWYQTVIEYCESKQYEFISYEGAIKELEENE